MATDEKPMQKQKLHAFEDALFKSIQRSQHNLAAISEDDKHQAVDLMLHLPTSSQESLAELFSMTCLLEHECRDTVASGMAESIADAYTQTFAASLLVSVGSSVDAHLASVNASWPTVGEWDFDGLLSVPVIENCLPSTIDRIIREEQLKHPPSPAVVSLAPRLQPATHEPSRPASLSQAQPVSYSVGLKSQKVDHPSTSNSYRFENDRSRVNVENTARVQSSAVSNVAPTECDPMEDVQICAKDFISAKQFIHQQEAKKKGYTQPPPTVSDNHNASKGKTLGSRKRFVPPMKRANDNMDNLTNEVSKRVFGNRNGGTSSTDVKKSSEDEPVDERLRNIDPKMIETIENEIMDIGNEIQWDDIAGLHHAKKSIQEVVIWPMQRPDIFSGLRSAPKGILLFGPPGTGKTMIGKCIASNAHCTFFSISASSLTSKWVGEGEKMVRALFAVARVHQPSVIFIDEIDSLLTQRTDGEFEASRKIKTEFLIQFDGAHVSKETDRLLIIGATNRPQEIDEAARRRLIKRYYIPLPDIPARQCIIDRLLKKQTHTISTEEILRIAEKTKGYSGSDMDGLCREAALGPIREIPADQIRNISLDAVRPMNYSDFAYALRQVRASVSDRDLDLYMQWNNDYGSMNDAVKKEI